MFYVMAIKPKLNKEIRRIIMGKIKTTTTKKTNEHVILIDGKETIIKTNCKTFGAPVMVDGVLVGNCAECKESKHCMIHEQNISDMREAETLLDAKKIALKADEEMVEMQAKMQEMEAKIKQAEADKASANLIINQKTIADLEEELRIAMIPVNAIQEKLKALRPGRKVQSGSSRKVSRSKKPWAEIFTMVNNGMDKIQARESMVIMGHKETVSKVFVDRIYWLHGIMEKLAKGETLADSSAKQYLDFELNGVGTLPEGLDPSTVNVYKNFCTEYTAWTNLENK